VKTRLFPAPLAIIALIGCRGEIGDMPTKEENTRPANLATVLGPGTDPGTVGMHRLNALEYDNTVNALLGLSQNIAEKSFIPDEQGTNGFDSQADALTMTDAEFQQYFSAADSLVEQVFAKPELALGIVTCHPAGANDAACLDQIIQGFGLRAYRRPITDDEATRFRALAADAVKNGEDFDGSVKQIVKMMMSSIPFLYRVEIDPRPDDTTPHQVGPYELASRLSYLLWSSMPDPALLDDAKSGALLNDDALLRAFDRMMSDPRASNFASSFAGQWLGGRSLGTHQVEATAFPAFSEDLRRAMVDELTLYFNEFLNGGLGWDQFLTARVNFVNGALAALYGDKSVPASQAAMTKVSGLDPNRIGFLGLGGFLTQSSYSYRTVPTLRGKWVLENLLGEEIPPPPAGVPPLDSAATAATDTMTQEENVRARLLAHRATPLCSACHSKLDPIGLGMENFDGIGAYRATYGNGQAIDATGELPDGTHFGSLAELATILSRGDRQAELLGFAAQQAMTYALSRPLNLDPPNDSDRPYLDQIKKGWAAEGYLLKALLREVVLNETFRARHGGM
jgi:hypothetical protein